MIDVIYQKTIEYLNTIDTKKRKKIGQFFTQPSIAEFMATLASTNKESIRVLDAGAGTGILVSAICEKYLKSKTVKNIEAVLYENNENVQGILKENLEMVSIEMKKYNKSFSYKIINKNFILDNEKHWSGEEQNKESELFDIVISNPPYKKIRKNDVEAIAMQDIVYGQPNLYFLFMAMSAKLLKEDGEMIFINPRSFTSGAYFREFRKWFLNNVELTNIHLFEKRGDIFKEDKVLQETLILKAKNTPQDINKIVISTSSDANFTDIKQLDVRKNIIIENKTKDSYVLIPTNKKDLDILNKINRWQNNLKSLGFKISTGKVVDFRIRDLLTNTKSNNTVPLFWPSNFVNNKIIHPIDREKSPQYIKSTVKSSSFLVENKDYLLVKRFSSKEEKKRIQCALYLEKDFKYDFIGIENHLNYIYKIDGNFTKEELYGLFALLNSSYIDNYYRILNGSTQVNAKEVNSIPLPDLDTIIEIGSIVLEYKEITVDLCDDIVSDFFVNMNKGYENAI